MLSKIEKFLIFVLTPIAAVLGYIYYLITQNQELVDKANARDAQARVDKFMNLEQVAKEKADNDEKDYNTLRTEYLEQHGKGGGELPPNN